MIVDNRCPRACPMRTMNIHCIPLSQSSIFMSCLHQAACRQLYRCNSMQSHFHQPLSQSQASVQLKQPGIRQHTVSTAALNQVGGSTVVQQQQASVADAAHHKQCPRFYAPPPLPPAAGATVQLEPEEAKHAVRVLRLRPGDAVELCDGQGGLVQCEVTATTKNSAMLMTTAAPVVLPWRGPKWVVAAACLTLKGGRTDWLVEKATELGAHSLIPLITERSQTGTNKDKFRALAQKAGHKKGSQPAASQAAAEAEGGEHQASRLERLALAATKQSLRAQALQVQPAMTLEQLLPQLQQAPVSLVAMAGAPPMLQVLQQQWKQGMVRQQQQHEQQQHVPQQNSCRSPWDQQQCFILIGPEGDFVERELAELSAVGVQPVGLGYNRLRTETAAVAALSAAVLYADCKDADL